MSALTEAFAEALAQAPAGEVMIETLEFDHTTLETPVYVAAGRETNIDLPLALGDDPTTFTALAISVVPDGVDSDGSVSAIKITMDNVSGTLLAMFRNTYVANEPIQVTYRAYTSTDLTQPGQVISDMELKNVDLTATTATATLTFREINTQSFPLRTYDSTKYPALQVAA